MERIRIEPDFGSILVLVLVENKMYEPHRVVIQGTSWRDSRSCEC